ncbi:hypothetical protein HC251_15005 [Iamia sp. SCSIO 61187]|uniref:hypothetical protein n=1 Tax=Iamia sp. SCSIO 61187 TaxID=2722752 RepID=UPI001C63309C|nr:hypothetical protein [Iamia sp. SCSIO 61187]QYG90966.1 hypothetical protein HC251_15005 [Iamia sp. SCSIO 61187]
MTGTRRRAGAALLVGVLALAGACGVEVPDDVAADIRDTTTTTEAPTTTETPRSDDPLEQALIDNGYTLAEAECGAENLRETLDEDEVQSIVDADTIEDISAGTARGFADALQPCVEDGADPGDPDDSGDGDGDGDGDGGGDADEPGDPGDDPDGDDPPDSGIGGMPGFGDDSEGDVSRSRFLAALISGGVPDGQARCIVDAVYSELDQEDINTLFHSDSEDDVPPDVLDAFFAIVDDCET